MVSQESFVKHTPNLLNPAISASMGKLQNRIICPEEMVISKAGCAGKPRGERNWSLVCWVLLTSLLWPSSHRTMAFPSAQAFTVRREDCRIAVAVGNGKI